MKMERIALLLLLLLLVAPGWAQEKTLLIVPLEIKGTYRPFSQDEMTTLLKQQVEKLAPDVKVMVLDSSPSMLSASDAARLGRDAGAGAVFYGDVRFKSEAKASSMTGGQPEGYPGGGIPAGFSSRYLVSVMGVAHGNLIDSATGELLAEAPVMFLENEMTGGTKDGPAMQEVEKKLATSCAKEIAHSLVKHLKEHKNNGKNP